MVFCSQQRCFTTRLVELILGYVLGVLAAFTLLTHLSQVLGIPFQVYVVVGILLAALLLVATARPAYRQLKQAQRPDRKALLLLIGVGVLCSILALVNHRRDADDYYYTPNAIYMLEHSDEPMGFEVHFLDGGENCDVISYSWGTSIPFEYSQAAVASVLGIDFLSVYYILTPALVGFLLPLALYYALSLFSEQPVVTVLGALITVGIVLLLGETHRTFGNFSLTRAYQGKTLLLAIGLPAFVGASIRFFESPSACRWTMLLALSTAMVGTTTSSIVLIPALASVLLVAHLLASPPKRHTRPAYILYLTSLGYVALYATFLVVNSHVDLRADSPINQGWPTTFSGHLAFFIHPDQPVTPLVVVITSVAALLLTSGKRRRFLAGWIVAVTVLYLNPLVAPLLIRYVTTPNAYWRLFYIYPFPLVAGVSAVYFFEGLGNLPRMARLASTALVLALLVGVHFLPSSTSIFRHGTSFNVPPGYELPEGFVEVAQAIVSQTPEGTMLAPRELSGIIPMLSSRHPQVRVRTDGVLLWFAECGAPELGTVRVGASEFVGGNRDRFPDFQEFLSIEGRIVRSIVLRGELMQSEDVRALLETHRFVNRRTVGAYVVVWR